MKKLIISLCFASLLVTSSIVAATSSTKSLIYKQIYIVTDANNVYDGSFNEACFTGANNFLREKIKKDDPKKNLWKNAYVKPRDTNTFNLESAYGCASRYGAKNIIFPGFNHGGPNIEPASNILEKCGGNGILVDIKTDFKKSDGSYIKNMISLSYKMEVATLYTGLASIGYFFNKYKDKNEIKLSTFGGLSNPFAVDNFMFGFLLSIEAFNEIWKNNDLKEKFAKAFEIDTKRNLVAKRIDIQEKNIGAAEFDYWYSKSFEPGHASGICEKLVNDDSNVILPVSGPQIIDLILAIKNKKKDDTYIIGVDIDVITSFPERFSNLFITSAIKPLGETTYSALAHTNEYINNNFDEAISDTQTKYLEANDLEVSKIDGNFTEEKLNGLWTGENLWFTGTISTSGGKYHNDNKITKEQFKILKEDLFKKENISKMSANFYNDLIKYENNQSNYGDKTYKYLNDIFGLKNDGGMIGKALKTIMGERNG